MLACLRKQFASFQVDAAEQQPQQIEVELIVANICGDDFCRFVPHGR
jgi:hypothetical protein